MRKITNFFFQIKFLNQKQKGNENSFLALMCLDEMPEDPKAVQYREEVIKTVMLVRHLTFFQNSIKYNSVNSRKKVNNLPRSQNFSDYIETLKIFKNIGCFDRHLYRSVALAYFGFIERPEIFENAIQLSEVDLLYNDLLCQRPDILDLPTPNQFAVLR